MHRAIAERAGHRAIAAAMSYVDHGVGRASSGSRPSDGPRPAATGREPKKTQEIGNLLTRENDDTSLVSEPSDRRLTRTAPGRAYAYAQSQTPRGKDPVPGAGVALTGGML